MLQVKLLLLHDLKNEDGIRLFFIDVWEAYTKVSLSPLRYVQVAANGSDTVESLPHYQHPNPESSIRSQSTRKREEASLENLLTLEQDMVYYMSVR